MPRPKVPAVISIIRPHATTAFFLSIFVPVFAESRDLFKGLTYSTPLLLCAAATYVINAIHDIEKDHINHPDRPLVKGALTPGLAVLLYFAFLLAALNATYALVPPDIALYYYLFLLMAISYGYVADHLTNVKPFYVAAATAIPIVIVFLLLPGHVHLRFLLVAVFLYTARKEISIDFLDRKGDPDSLWKRMNPHILTMIAFGLQTAGIAALLPALSARTDVFIFLTAAALEAHCLYIWIKRDSRYLATLEMRAVTFLGLYFLVKR